MRKKQGNVEKIAQNPAKKGATVGKIARNSRKFKEKVDQSRPKTEFKGENAMKSGKTNSFISQSVLLKAFGHKYIRRIPKKSGKGFWYIYAETFKKPFQALAQIFGIKRERVSSDYEKHEIQKNYGASKKTFAAHVLEYFTNRLKWDTIFSKEENREKYKKPRKPAAPKEKTGEAGKTGNRKRTGGGRKKKPTDDAIKVNRSL